MGFPMEQPRGTTPHVAVVRPARPATGCRPVGCAQPVQQGQVPESLALESLRKEKNLRAAKARLRDAAFEEELAREEETE